jgi:hypothetical protein
MTLVPVPSGTCIGLHRWLDLLVLPQSWELVSPGEKRGRWVAREGLHNIDRNTRAESNPRAVICRVRLYPQIFFTLCLLPQIIPHIIPREVWRRDQKR